MEIPIPEVYVQVTVADDGEEEFGVVDGQQRLRTILQFVGLERTQDQEGEDNNNFSLEKLAVTSIHKDKMFADITGQARKNFFQYEICVRFLYTDDRKEVEDVSRGSTNTRCHSNRRNSETRPSTVLSQSSQKSWPTKSIGLSTASLARQRSGACRTSK